MKMGHDDHLSYISIESSFGRKESDSSLLMRIPRGAELAVNKQGLLGLAAMPVA